MSIVDTIVRIADDIEDSNRAHLARLARARRLTIRRGEQPRVNMRLARARRLAIRRGEQPRAYSQPASRGATSFEELRTVDGVIHPTFQETCVTLGLLENDEQWRKQMETAAEFMMPRQLRQTFVITVVFSAPSDPATLFEEFWESMCEDYTVALRRARGTLAGHFGVFTELDMRRAMLLIDVEDRLQRLQDDDSLENHQLPSVSVAIRAVVS